MTHRLLAIILACGATTLFATTLGAQPGRTHAGAPAVSPDGKHIAYIGDRDDGTQIFVSNADGSHEIQLTEGKFEYANPLWSDDGREVLFATFAKDTSYLFAIAPTGGQPRQVAVVPGRNPMPLPDGRTVLFMTGGWTDTQLAIAYRNTTNVHRISDGVGATWNPKLSPDRKQVAYTRSTKESRASVWVMNVDGTGAHQVTHFPPSDGGAQVPAWSPDGKKLAVQAAVPSAKDLSKHVGHIWIVDIATGKATKLAPHAQPYLDETPSWFPDGKRIAFQSDRTGRVEVWVMNADGTGARQITK